MVTSGAGGLGAAKRMRSAQLARQKLGRSSDAETDAQGFDEVARLQCAPLGNGPSTNFVRDSSTIAARKRRLRGMCTAELCDSLLSLVVKSTGNTGLAWTC